MSIKIVQNDTKPYLEFDITQEGVPVDLTGCTVKFYMKDADTGTVKIRQSHFHPKTPKQVKPDIKIVRRIISHPE